MPHNRFRSKSAAAAVGPDLLIAVPPGGDGVGREKLVDGELDLPEQVAGVLLAFVAVAGALLVGYAVVVHRDQQLGVPFQTDHGELAQGDEQAVDVSAGHQLLGEAGRHRHRDFRAAALPGTALADIHQLHTEDQRVHRLHD